MPCETALRNSGLLPFGMVIRTSGIADLLISVRRRNRGLRAPRQTMMSRASDEEISSPLLPARKLMRLGVGFDRFRNCGEVPQPVDVGDADRRQNERDVDDGLPHHAGLGELGALHADAAGLDERLQQM